jgi:hypothetical protein
MVAELAEIIADEVRVHMDVLQNDCDFAVCDFNILYL